MTDQKPPATRVEDDMHVDLAGKQSYGAYLHLDELLSAQRPLTQEHDEVAFIVIHHVQELWLKLIAHELEAAAASIRRDDLPPAFKSFARVTRIQEQLIRAWDVLSTMTPADYLAFRDALGPASGFQSFQYRLVEFRLGAKDARMIQPHRHHAEHHAILSKALVEPSVYDEAMRLLARRDPEKHFDLYELAEELVDMEDWFQQWRFRHMKTVERIIGFKRGTGGSSGVGFLKTALERSFFPELWELRTLL